MRICSLLVCAAVFFSPSIAIAWDGYDYESGGYVEIGKGNLVREGEEIEYYDYESGDYRSADVEDIQGSGDGAEVEVKDRTIDRFFVSS